jgi:hypothetical protein
MAILSAVQAGHYLGVTEKTVRNMINRGELEVLSVEPVRLDSRHVDDVLKARQVDALHDLARGHKTPVDLAREARRVLHPSYATTTLPDRVAEEQRLRMSLVSDTAKLLFGQAAITAACTGDEACRWCRAREYAAVLKTWAPTQYAEGFRALFDQAPCSKCGPALYGAVMESLRAQVHAGGERPSGGRVAPSAAEREAAREYVTRRPVTAAAQPVRQDDDDGRSMVNRRLQQTRARLKEAKRSGDQRRAIQLTQTLQALTADAARVDGLAASAARPGRLRCGHLLASGCSCPRRASKR